MRCAESLTENLSHLYLDHFEYGVPPSIYSVMGSVGIHNMGTLDTEGNPNPRSAHRRPMTDTKKH